MVFKRVQHSAKNGKVDIKVLAERTVIQAFPYFKRGAPANRPNINSINPGKIRSLGKMSRWYCSEHLPRVTPWISIEI